ncbi:MAG: LLM class flavin-dependent oxidoreductase, partial [Nitrososphaerota archaeon]
MTSPTRLGLGVHTSSSVAEIVQLGLTSEEKGFDSVWLSEDPYFRDLFSIAAILGRSTKRIQICAGIANYYSRHPVYMAMTAATLGEICNNRFVLGLGRNVKSVIEGQLG